MSDTDPVPAIVRWARAVAATVPVGLLAVVGVRLGASGRRVAGAAPSTPLPPPLAPSAASLSAVADAVYAASLLVGIAVAAAVGWLLVAGAVRAVATVTR